MKKLNIKRGASEKPKVIYLPDIEAEIVDEDKKRVYVKNPYTQEIQSWVKNSLPKNKNGDYIIV